MANFLWGSAGQKMSPAQVAEQRKIAQALMEKGSDTAPVGHWAAALNRGLQGYLGGRQAYQAREAEAAGRAGYEAKKAGMANATAFGGADPVAAALSGGSGGGTFDGDIASGISETASALGMDPVDLATIISYETAGTFDPTKAGPTTQWGQHRGLIQFGEPQAAEYGVDWNNPVGSQLGANGAIVNYFTKNGWQPGMGLLDAYSIVNAGAPGRYNASDANNGGAPGTVADKVNNQMAGHRQKAMSLFGGGGAAPANSTANIAALLADEWLPDSERAVLQSQYDAALKQQDPMYQAQYEGQVLKNQAARQPQAPKPIEVGGVLLDPTTYQPIFDSREKKAGYTQLSPDQAAQFGLDPSRQWQVSGDNKIEPIGGTPLVQNNLGGEKQWDQESAKLWAKRYDGMVGGASNARDMLAMYDLAESAINSGVRTGFGASQEQALRKMAAGLGIGAEDAEKLAGGELLNTVQNRMALMMRNPDGGMGMPGAMSDADRKFLSDSQVGLDRTPEGNRKMLAAFRAMEQRKIEISELADQYITENGMLDQGFNRVVKDYAEANPMFKVGPVVFETMDDLLNADISSMTTEQMDAWEARMRELKNGR